MCNFIIIVFCVFSYISESAFNSLNENVDDWQLTEKNWELSFQKRLSDSEKAKSGWWQMNSFICLKDKRGLELVRT